MRKLVQLKKNDIICAVISNNIKVITDTDCP